MDDEVGGPAAFLAEAASDEDNKAERLLEDWADLGSRGGGGGTGGAGGPGSSRGWGSIVISG